MTSLAGWLAYALVITMLSALLGAKEVTMVFALTTQQVTGNWTIGFAWSLLNGIVFGGLVSFLIVRRRVSRR
jgi:hypothetical protein